MFVRVEQHLKIDTQGRPNMRWTIMVYTQKLTTFRPSRGQGLLHSLPCRCASKLLALQNIVFSTISVNTLPNTLCTAPRRGKTEARYSYRVTDEGIQYLLYPIVGVSWPVSLLQVGRGRCSFLFPLAHFLGICLFFCPFRKKDSIGNPNNISND